PRFPGREGRAFYPKFKAPLPDREKGRLSRRGAGRGGRAGRLAKGGAGRGPGMSLPRSRPQRAAREPRARGRRGGGGGSRGGEEGASRGEGGGGKASGMCRGRSRSLVPEGTERGASPEQPDPRTRGGRPAPMVLRGKAGEVKGSLPQTAPGASQSELKI